MQIRKLALGLLAATMLTAPAAASGDQETITIADLRAPAIETITVTARRQAEDLERVPVSVTAISSGDIRQADLKSALDLQFLAPSLTVSGNLSSRDDNVFTIRGQSQPFGGADPGVQTYFNEVPFIAGGPGNYYDMDNIQVLRGPQGTLFGRNTTGGAVLFQPKKPTDQFGAYLDGQIGDYSLSEIQGAVNVPLIGGKLMLRLAGDAARRDGFTKDVSDGRDLDNLSYDALRLGITVKPFAGFENYLAFSYLNNHNHGTGAELTAIAPESALQERFGDQVAGMILPSVTSGLTDYFMSMGLPQMQAAALAAQQAPAIANAQASQAIDGFYRGMFQPALASQQGLGVRQTSASIPLFYKRHFWSLTDTARYDVSEHLHIRNIFGFIKDKTQSAFDYDGSAMTLLEIPNSRAWEQNSEQVSEEVQLLGETGDGLLSGMLGFYYEHGYRGGYAEVERDVFGGGSGTGPLAALGSTEVDAFGNGGSSLAVYGNGTVDASQWLDGLSFTGGGRFTWDHKVATAISCLQPAGYPACPFPLTAPPLTSEIYAESFHAPTWNLGANWQANDDTLVYAAWRRGYKSGGFNSGAAGTSYLLFKPEYLTDLEIGSKNNWEILGVPGRTNIDLYYGWYQDVQKNDIVGFSGVARPPVVLTVNAAKANIKGLEFETSFIPDENFQIGAFYSFTEAAYDSFVLPMVLDASGQVTATADHKGDAFAYTPKHKFGTTARFHLPVPAEYGMPWVSLSWYWQSKVWFSDLSDSEPDAFQGDYGLLNLRADWNNILGAPFDLGVFVNNLTDRNYKSGANAMEHQIGTNASIFGPPRLFGVELRARLGEEANR
jgi:iron complex outermembrane recepter protein